MLKNMAALNDVILKMAGNIDILTTELEEIKNENKNLKKIYSEPRDENKNAISKAPVTNTLTQSCTNLVTSALIVKTSDKASISNKRVKIAKVSADVSLNRTRETTNVALVMNFKSKINMEKANRAIDDYIETTTRIRYIYMQKIMLTNVNLLDEDAHDDGDDDNDDGNDDRERFKERIID